MQLNEKTIWENIQTISALEKWRVVPLRDFNEIVPGNFSKVCFYNQVKKLSDKGIVQKVRVNTGERTTRYAVVLSEAMRKKRGVKYEGEHFFHDLIVSTAASGFMRFPGFVDVFFEHETFSDIEEKSENDTKIHPDAEIIIDTPENRDINIAIEVELTRKSESRIISKLSSYAASERWILATYFFLDEKIMKTYMQAVLNIPNDKTRRLALQKVAFVHVINPFKIREDIFDLKVNLNNESLTFREIFNIKD